MSNFFTSSLSAGLITIGLWLGPVSPSHAAVLASENWDSYTTGNSVAGATGGTGWSGGWAVGAPSQGYLELTRGPSSGFTALSYPNNTSSGANYLNLASGFGGPQFNYVSRTLNTSTFASAGLATGGLIGANNATLYGSFLYTNDSSGNAANANATLTLNGGTGGGSSIITLAQPASPAGGNSNFFLYRINYGSNFQTNSTITYWVNPNFATFNGTGGTTTSVGNYSFTNFNITTTYNGGDGSQLGFDDIKFGTSFSDVTPAPEPATWLGMILLAAAVGYGGFRKAFGVQRTPDSQIFFA